MAEEQVPDLSSDSSDVSMLMSLRYIHTSYDSQAVKDTAELIISEMLKTCQ